MSKILGDLDICRSLYGRRIDGGLTSKTLTIAEQLDRHSANWQVLDSASAEDVILPDATTLNNGWSVVIKAETSTLTVQTYDATTPVDLKDVEPGRAYEFTLLDNGTDEGEWHVNFLEEADSLATPRYVDTFNATTDWGAAVGGVYTRTITQATHQRGTSPQADTFEESGSDFVQVEAGELKILANGDVEISVPENPDCRFAGKAVLI